MSTSRQEGDIVLKQAQEIDPSLKEYLGGALRRRASKLGDSIAT